MNFGSEAIDSKQLRQKLSEVTWPPLSTFFGEPRGAEVHSQMSMTQDLASRVRLGGFELDHNSGELRLLGTINGDGRVLLREQPFHVLRMLIERGGKIGNRQEI